MGSFLSQLVGKLLGDSKPPAEHEIDHNVCICCGTLNVASEHEHEKDSDQEKTDDDKNSVC